MTANLVPVVVNPARTVGRVRPELFGSFVENLYACVYGGVYDPAGPAADAEGFRADVLEATRAMGVSLVRFPGGCFAPFYHWKDGVGPREKRPKSLYGYPGWPASNDFGTDEFVSWCRKARAQPFLCVNMGSGTPEEARDWVEYCNTPSGGRWADLRVSHGFEKPHGVKYWALGNEISGAWEFGHAETPEDYIRRAREFARVMRRADESIRFVLAGAHFPLNHRHADWNRKVLEELFDYADFISMHHYIGLMGRSGFSQGQWKQLGPRKVHLRLTEYMREVEEAYAVLRSDIRLVQHRRNRLDRPIGAALTEYNPWYRTWGDEASALTERYNLSDALLVAAYFNIFIRNADVAALANMAQLVNVLPALVARGGGAGFYRQTISHAQELFLANRGLTAVDCWCDSPAYKGEFFPTVPYLDASASVSDDRRRLVLNLINRHPTNPLAVRLSLPGLAAQTLPGRLLTHANLNASNSFARPDNVHPVVFRPRSANHILLPPMSLAVVEAELSRPRR